MTARDIVAAQRSLLWVMETAQGRVTMPFHVGVTNYGPPTAQLHTGAEWFAWAEYLAADGDLAEVKERARALLERVSHLVLIAGPEMADLEVSVMVPVNERDALLAQAQELLS